MDVTSKISRSACSFFGIIAALCLCTACTVDRQPQHDVAGHLPDLQFTLTDDQGRTVSAADYRGQDVALYFGFSLCPSECPLTMAHLTHVLGSLPVGPAATRVLFVSLDPQQDTPAILHRYLQSFDSAHITGLTGSDHEILALVKRYRAAYRPASDPAKPIDIAHSNTLFLFDRNGHARYLIEASAADGELRSALVSLASIPKT